MRRLIKARTVGGAQGAPSPMNTRKDHMSETELSELGPVDFLVIEFPAGHQNFTGEMVEELLALVDAGTIRVIDAIILTKDENGEVDAVELEDAGDLGG